MNNVLKFYGEGEEFSITLNQFISDLIKIRDMGYGDHHVRIECEAGCVVSPPSAITLNRRENLIYVTDVDVTYGVN